MCCNGKMRKSAKRLPREEWARVTRHRSITSWSKPMPKTKLRQAEEYFRRWRDPTLKISLPRVEFLEKDPLE